MAALSASIAQCMTGVTSQNIKYLNVTAPVATRRNLRTVEELVLSAVGTSNTVTASYYVAANVAGATYTSLSTELTTNVANGNFNGYLTNNTALFKGSSQLSTATSSSVTTSDVGFDDDFDLGNIGITTISAGAIAGIVIGAVCFCSCLLGGAYFFFFARKSSAANDSRTDEVTLKVGSSITTQSGLHKAPAPSVPSSPIVIMNENPLHEGGIRRSSARGSSPVRPSPMASGSVLTTDAAARSISDSKRASSVSSGARSSVRKVDDEL